jgi:hypothetical protein
VVVPLTTSGEPPSRVPSGKDASYQYVTLCVTVGVGVGRRMADLSLECIQLARGTAEVRR